jgi:thioredoxin-related protein
MTIVAFGLLAEIRQLRKLGFAESQLQLNDKRPEFSAVDLASNRKIESVNLPKQEHSMLFISTECGGCLKLLSDLRTHHNLGMGRVLVICQGPESDCRRILERAEPNLMVLADLDGEIARRYKVTGTPAVALIDSEDKIRGFGKPRNAEEFMDLKARFVS